MNALQTVPQPETSVALDVERVRAEFPILGLKVNGEPLCPRSIAFARAQENKRLALAFHALLRLHQHLPLDHGAAPPRVPEHSP